MAARQHCPPWADLRSELVGLILGRLPLADRVRMGAACRPWRRAAQQEPLPPPLPWLALLDGAFLSVPGGEIHRRMTLPDDASFYGSMGDWLLLKHSGGGDHSLMNPFTKDVVRIPKESFPLGRPTCSVKPVLLSTLDLSPDSSRFAILTTDDYRFESLIFVCQPGTSTAFTVPDCELISDMTFFDGKLYALSLSNLYVLLDLETGSSSKGKLGARVDPSMTMSSVADAVDNPRVTCRTIAGEIRHVCAYWNYLVESSGKLLHVRRLIGYLITSPEEGVGSSRTLSFEVFEADLATNSGSRGEWRRVNALGGRALFVGMQSKSLPAPECGAREDCIYFVCDYDRGSSAADPLRDCGVFDMRTGMITPLLPDDVVVQQQGCKGRPTWFVPTKTI
ncbi:unnamed protein product [Urochloa decumbens]|uniref:KIB1-4 beta-propeller domain-containing protein n=1 Tax=Urochloa decumbens TaxID=240449 RepID=A0ABC9E7I5_9POAL